MCGPLATTLRLQHALRDSERNRCVDRGACTPFWQAPEKEEVWVVVIYHLHQQCLSPVHSQ